MDTTNTGKMEMGSQDETSLVSVPIREKYGIILTVVMKLSKKTTKPSFAALILLLSSFMTPLSYHISRFHFKAYCRACWYRRNIVGFTSVEEQFRVFR